MAKRLSVDLFCEDQAHEELLRALLDRLCRAEGVAAAIATRSARGGHGRAQTELDLYQRIVRTAQPPDLLVVGIDTNCSTQNKVIDEIKDRIDDSLFPHYAIACPNPHIELWYLADPDAVQEVIGTRPPHLDPKCGKQTRNELKRVLANCIRQAGLPVLFGGPQYAPELADTMDLFSVGKVDPGFKLFVRDVRTALKQLVS